MCSSCVSVLLFQRMVNVFIGCDVYCMEAVNCPTEVYIVVMYTLLSSSEIFGLNLFQSLLLFALHGHIFNGKIIQNLNNFLFYFQQVNFGRQRQLNPLYPMTYTQIKSSKDHKTHRLLTNIQKTTKQTML